MKFIFSQKKPVSFPVSVLRVSVVEKKEDTEFWKDEQGVSHLALAVKNPEKMTQRKLLLLFRQIIREARAHKIESLVLSLSDFSFSPFTLNEKELGRLFAENALMANYEYLRYKSKPEEKMVKEIYITDANADVVSGVRRGEAVGICVNECRDLANMPGGEMTPSVLASAAHTLFKGTSAKVSVLGEKEMKKLGMGAILGVSRGSREEAKFIIVEYNGSQKKGDAPTVLIGKGVTFDSGGLNLKPGDNLNDMHLDMSGGAAVLAALATVARLKLNVNAIALVPAAENMPSGESYRPGDVLRSLSGKTIEVGNTDAEGRLLLADALAYAKRYKPRTVIDVATLTGAAIVTMGLEASLVMSPSEELARDIQTLGEESGDYIWPLPLWEEYDRMVKGNYADVTNTSNENGRYAQTIIGGTFLKQFAEGYTWAHIDMAPREVSNGKEFLSKGAAGAPVRLLVRYLEKVASL